jgi:pyruvate formate-lyase activating enzyme-like uncharacterized protein
MKSMNLELIRAEFADRFDQIRFASDAEAAEFEKQRADLQKRLEGRVQWGFSNTKLDCNNLSQGCRLCGDGSWSCLFINSRCNCKCFYCPAPQNEDCLPTTNSVSFSSPSDYVAYLREFGFRGVSISGGEPLLTPELTIEYIRAVRDAFDDMYIWMYTNGSLVTEEILHRLKDAGLNEIRFDIGATDYSLSNLKHASIIPVVTVEIPAVPQEAELVKSLLPELEALGVTHLNLHQLRLTPYNFDKLIKMDYTYTADEKPVVLQSELAALDIMLHALDKGSKIGVNYCSFPYKNRYQWLASRKRNGAYMVKPFEEITANGYIRLMTVTGEPEQILAAKAVIAENTDRYEISRDKKYMHIHPSQRNLMPEGLGLKVAYFSARQLPAVSYRNPFKTVSLDGGKSIVIERFRVSADFESVDTQSTYEMIPEGLTEY